MKYQDFTLCLRDSAAGQLGVQVTASPVGRMRAPEIVRFEPAALAGWSEKPERGCISSADLYALGECLAELLLPNEAREMFMTSLERVGSEQGLRVRFVPCASNIAALPWEYLYLSRAGVEKGLDGFIALDPRISPVRDEPIPFVPPSLSASVPLKLLVGLASPSDYEPLDLTREGNLIARAIENVPRIEATFVEHLTLDALVNAGKRFDMFHFAGHGRMTAEGGSLLLERADHRADATSAEQLALTLRACGVRLAVLGACESGRRDNGMVWSGVAPALMKLGIGAAVAYQFPITDESAIVFAARFYRAIAAGLGPDEAVSAGRLALMTAARGMGAEWGTPVLYMRESDGKVFPELADDASLEPERKALAIALEQRIKHLRGKLVGVRAREIREGTVAVQQSITQVGTGATASGVEAKTIAGGEITVAQEIESVDEGGTVTGVTIGGEN